MFEFLSMGLYCSSCRFRQVSVPCQTNPGCQLPSIRQHHCKLSLHYRMRDISSHRGTRHLDVAACVRGRIKNVEKVPCQRAHMLTHDYISNVPFPRARSWGGRTRFSEVSQTSYQGHLMPTQPFLGNDAHTTCEARMFVSFLTNFKRREFSGLSWR